MPAGNRRVGFERLLLLMAVVGAIGVAAILTWMRLIGTIECNQNRNVDPGVNWRGAARAAWRCPDDRSSTEIIFEANTQGAAFTRERSPLTPG
jgi:hypothetical protein